MNIKNILVDNEFDINRIHALHIVLVLALIWPGIHIYLSNSIGFSPWRYSGWGMYSVIQSPIYVEIVLYEGIIDPKPQRQYLEIESTGIILTEVLEFSSRLRVSQVSDFDRKTIELADLNALTTIEEQVQKFIRLNDLSALRKCLKTIGESSHEPSALVEVKVLVSEHRLDMHTLQTYTHMRRLKYDWFTSVLTEFSPILIRPKSIHL